MLSIPSSSASSMPVSPRRSNRRSSSSTHVPPRYRRHRALLYSVCPISWYLFRTEAGLRYQVLAIRVLDQVDSSCG
ncbi:hypothetical protein D9M72_568720 [compost metagenome]